MVLSFNLLAEPYLYTLQGQWLMPFNDDTVKEAASHYKYEYKNQSASRHCMVPCLSENRMVEKGLGLFWNLQCARKSQTPLDWKPMSRSKTACMAHVVIQNKKIYCVHTNWTQGIGLPVCVCWRSRGISISLYTRTVNAQLRLLCIATCGLVQWDGDLVGNLQAWSCPHIVNYYSRTLQKLSPK